MKTMLDIMALRQTLVNIEFSRLVYTARVASFQMQRRAMLIVMMDQCLGGSAIVRNRNGYGSGLGQVWIYRTQNLYYGYLDSDIR